MPQSQGYNPLSAQPYQAYQPPEVSPPPPPTVAEQQPGYQFTGAPTTKLGAVAGVLDNIFRGYMRGREEGEVRKVMQMKAKTDNLQNSYNQDAALLYQMAQSGVSQDSPEYKQAVSAVQGSWGALQDWVGQHVNGEKTKSKKASKTGAPPTQAETQQQLMADLQSQDPNVKAKALFQLRQKMGPPVLWQVQQFNTPEAQAARKAQGIMGQAGVINAQNTLTHEQAQQSYDQISAIPEGQRTDAQRAQFDQARAILFPPRETGAKELYKLGNGNYEWYWPGEQPEGASAVPRGTAKLYKYADGSLHYDVPGTQPADATVQEAGSGMPKLGTFGDFMLKKYGPQPTAAQYESGRRQWAQAGHVAGEGGSGGPSDKAYQKWRAYYKEHYPNLTADDQDALARRKVEGTSAISAGEIAHDALTEPKQFDNEVLSLAINNLRHMPKYSGTNPAVPNLDDALANIVGQGDYGYQYHPADYLKESGHGPDSHGMYSGNVNQQQLSDVERDLQNQIRIVLSGSKVQGLSPEERRAVLARMSPLTGPAAGRGTTPGSPQASPQAAPEAASSRPSGGGEHHASKGTVRKTAFLKANPGATDADWNAIKPQLVKQGYDTKDD